MSLCFLCVNLFDCVKVACIEAVGVTWRVLRVGVLYYFVFYDCFGMEETVCAMRVMRAEQLFDLIGTLGFEK